MLPDSFTAVTLISSLETVISFNVLSVDGFLINNVYVAVSEISSLLVTVIVYVFTRSGVFTVTVLLPTSEGSVPIWTVLVFTDAIACTSAFVAVFAINVS